MPLAEHSRRKVCLENIFVGILEHGNVIGKEECVKEDVMQSCLQLSMTTELFI